MRIFFLLTPALLLCWTNRAMAQVQPQQRAPVMNDAVQGGWRPADLRHDVDLWSAIVEEHPGDQQARLNKFRSARNEALARNKGELPPADRKNLRTLAEDIAAVDPNSFETHLARFHLEFPAPGAFMHLDLAKARDYDRPELIAPLLVDAARRADDNAMMRHGKALRQQAGVAEGLWALADDILRSVDQGAILIAAGEMDAYPIWARQFGEGHRRDVLTVDMRMLVDAAYRHRIWGKAGARGTVPDHGSKFIELLAQATDRPVFLSIALGPDRIALLRDRVYVTGMALRYNDVPIDNIPVLKEHWSKMNKTTEAGPLGTNYLLPGAVLLRHYRTMGDERNSALLEHELRALARAYQATDRLYSTGVLEH